MRKSKPFINHKKHSPTMLKRTALRNTPRRFPKRHFKRSMIKKHRKFVRLCWSFSNPLYLKGYFLRFQLQQVQNSLTTFSRITVVFLEVQFSFFTSCPSNFIYISQPFQSSV